MTRYLIALLAVAAVALSACGVGPDKSREDARDTQNVDKSAPTVLAFNNHFPNVEMKCDRYGHRVYVGSHNSSKGNNIIVMPDPTCPGYVKGAEPIVAVSGR